MIARIELPDRDVLVHVLQHRSSIMVEVAVVGRGEDGDDGWELLCSCFSSHLVPLLLDFMCTDDAEEVVPFEEIADGFIAGMRHDIGKSKVRLGWC